MLVGLEPWLARRLKRTGAPWQDAGLLRLLFGAARRGHQPSSAIIGRSASLSGRAVTAAQWRNGPAPGAASAGRLRCGAKAWPKGLVWPDCLQCPLRPVIRQVGCTDVARVKRADEHAGQHFRIRR